MNNNNHDAQGAITVRGVTHEFGRSRGDATSRGRMNALEDINLIVPRGQFLAIVGPSGCGKTTLMNMMAGLIKASSGVVTRDGRPATSLARNVGYMFARPGLLPWRTARGNVELGLEFRGVSKSRAREMASELLRQVGLSKSEASLPSELSQGMRQRWRWRVCWSSTPTTC